MNTPVDGVTCDTYFFQKHIFKYWYGKSNIMDLVDTNHNANNSGDQMIEGSWATIMGSYVNLSVYSENFQGITWVTDNSIIWFWSISSLSVICQNNMKNKHGGKHMWRVKISLGKKLYFKRPLLFGANRQKLWLKIRVLFSWTPMICFTWFHTIVGKYNYLANKINMVSETIRIFLLVPMNYIPNYTPSNITNIW